MATVNLSVEEFNALQAEVHKLRAEKHDVGRGTAEPEPAKKEGGLGKFNAGLLKKKNLGFGFHKGDKDKDKALAAHDERDDRSDEGRLSVDRQSRIDEAVQEETRQYQLQLSELQKAYRDSETRNIALREQLKEAQAATAASSGAGHTAPPPPESPDPQLTRQLEEAREELAAAKTTIRGLEAELEALRAPPAVPSPQGSPVASEADLRKQLAALLIQRETREHELERLRTANGELKVRVDKLVREHGIELQRANTELAEAKAKLQRADAETSKLAHKMTAMSSQELEEIQRLSTQVLSVSAERDDLLVKVSALQTQLEVTAKLQQEVAKLTHAKFDLEDANRKLQAAEKQAKTAAAEASARAEVEKAERTKAQSLLDEIRRTHEAALEAHAAAAAATAVREQELKASAATVARLTGQLDDLRRQAREQDRQEAAEYLRTAVVQNAVYAAQVDALERRLGKLSAASMERDRLREEAERLQAALDKQQSELRDMASRNTAREQDQEAEYRIRLKKSQQLIRELQAQLGKAADPAFGTAAAAPAFEADGFPPVHRVASTASIDSNSPRVEAARNGHHARSGSVVSDDLTVAASRTASQGTAEEDTIQLIRANTQLQQRIWTLEAQVATMRVDLQHMKEDSEKKSAIIGSYVSQTTITKAAAAAAPKTGLKGVAVKMRPKNISQMLKSKAGTQMKENMQHIVEEALAHCLELEKENERLREALAQFQPLEETA